MKLRACVLGAAASLSICGAAAAQDESAVCKTTPWLCWSSSTGRDVRPSTGMDALASGVVLTAIGALSFATAPVCLTSVVPGPEQGSCVTVSFAAGTPFLVLGVPLIAFGAVQHAKYEDWAKRHPALIGLSLSPTSGGGAIAWSARF